jgi:GntR family transcriptional regulator
MFADLTFAFLLDPNSGNPLYRQLMDHLRLELFAGRLQPGTMLPSVRQLARELSINPMTVSKAYSRLHEEGALERVPGLGMRVPQDSDRGLQERLRRELLPRLQEVVELAGKAGLSRSQLLSLIEPLLEDLNHE